MKLAARKLFDSHLDLAKRGARRFRASYPGFTYPEVYQIALEGLWYASLHFSGAGAFSGYALQQIAWRLKRYFFACETNAPSSKASKDARAYETTADFLSDEGRTISALDKASDEFAEREFESAPGDEHRDAVIAAVEDAIEHLKTLTPRERIALRGYFRGLGYSRITERLGFSPKSDPSGFIRSGVSKLREHFRRRGFATLPIEAPLPAAGRPPSL